MQTQKTKVYFNLVLSFSVLAFLLPLPGAQGAEAAQGADSGEAEIDRGLYCGPLVLAKMKEILQWKEIPIQEAAKRCRLRATGTTLAALLGALRSEGIATCAARLNPGNLLRDSDFCVLALLVRDPAIQSPGADWHYVIVANRVGDSVEIWDPMKMGWLRWEMRKIVRDWEGHALLVFRNRGQYWRYVSFHGSAIRETVAFCAVAAALTIILLMQVLALRRARTPAPKPGGPGPQQSGGPAT